MKKPILALILMLCWQAAPAADNAYQLKVDGLACPFCAYGVEKQLNRVQGVESIATDIKNGTVTVTMHEGATLKQAEATLAVAKAGFTLRGFNRKEASE
jgi:mercuric ion binding protein